MDAMVKDHEKDLAEFQKEANEATDPDLKEFAETTAKMVQKHSILPGKLKASCNKCWLSERGALAMAHRVLS
jgi:putative membrane protein